MKSELISHNKNSLIIFFCGFYTDAECFLEFDDGKNDILFVWDYSDMEHNPLLEFDFYRYTKISAIAYSYGVWALNFVYNENSLPHIDQSCAISGTFCPVDNNFGVNEKIYDLMEKSLNSQTIDKFINKMLMGSNIPIDIRRAKRTLDNLSAELRNIRLVSGHTWFQKNFAFDKVILTKKDKIFPYSSQDNFWAKHNNRVELETGHFPFFEFKNFDEILEN